jgi:YfiH family protein
MRQVHGAGVAVVDRPGAAEPPEADAIATTVPGLVLVVLVADCTPVMLADPRAGVVGVAHAGRRGLVAGVVPALVSAMRGLGANDLVARVGPSICGRCYEVPIALREEVSASVPEARSVTWQGTPSLDVAAGVVAQLAPHCRELRWLPGCSREDPELFSYRRASVTGRYAGLAWLR